MPSDTQAALSSYLWAARLGHARAALFAANLLYAQSCSRANSSGTNEEVAEEAAQLYLQAAVAGIPDAMNSYGIMLEEGRVTPTAEPDPHQAAAWYYRACVHGMHKAHLNLVMLLTTTPVYSVVSTTANGGQEVTLAAMKEYLRDYFRRSDVVLDEEHRENILHVVDSIDDSEDKVQQLMVREQERRSSLGYSATAAASILHPQYAANAANAAGRGGGRGGGGPYDESMSVSTGQRSRASSRRSRRRSSVASITSADGSSNVNVGFVPRSRRASSNAIVPRRQSYAPRRSSGSPAVESGAGAGAGLGMGMDNDQSRRYRADSAPPAGGMSGEAGSETSRNSPMASTISTHTHHQMLKRQQQGGEGEGEGGERGGKINAVVEGGYIYRTDGPISPPAYVPRPSRYASPGEDTSKPKPLSNAAGPGRGGDGDSFYDRHQDSPPQLRGGGRGGSSGARGDEGVVERSAAIGGTETDEVHNTGAGAESADHMKRSSVRQG